jgi:drug/metabolite transporter (DMT)-like permease
MTDIETSLARALPYLGMSAVVIGNVAANIFIKLGADRAAGRTLWFGLLGWPTLVGIGFFGVSVLLYAWVLKHLPLHLAQSMAALQFIGVILAAALFFDETISIWQWLGFALIVLGLAIVTR